jgi:hypothetical protein
MADEARVRLWVFVALVVGVIGFLVYATVSSGGLH